MFGIVLDFCLAYYTFHSLIIGVYAMADADLGQGISIPYNTMQSLALF